ncbi:hypothetical protein E4U09_007571 [Claviceps aff. purpurea]|uniref:Uncharacterized protein n=1 Tax=Claviceps aff. purpurea TaxID=1967640 RepID=A0A9P7U4W6_9HYPO|nr:hypothetical protein E4U09_007571 [Claviceps aff. purpurea]
MDPDRFLVAVFPVQCSKNEAFAAKILQYACLVRVVPIILAESSCNGVSRSLTLELPPVDAPFYTK